MFDLGEDLFFFKPDVRFKLPAQRAHVLGGDGTFLHAAAQPVDQRVHLHVLRQELRHVVGYGSQVLRDERKQQRLLLTEVADRLSIEELEEPPGGLEALPLRGVPGEP